MQLSRLREVLGTFPLIVNTVPAMLLDRETLRCVRRDALILDLASKPGGDDNKAISNVTDHHLGECGYAQTVYLDPDCRNRCGDDRRADRTSVTAAGKAGRDQLAGGRNSAGVRCGGNAVCHAVCFGRAYCGAADPSFIRGFTSVQHDAGHKPEYCGYSRFAGSVRRRCRSGGRDCFIPRIDRRIHKEIPAAGNPRHRGNACGTDHGNFLYPGRTPGGGNDCSAAGNRNCSRGTAGAG